MIGTAVWERAAELASPSITPVVAIAASFVRRIRNANFVDKTRCGRHARIGKSLVCRGLLPGMRGSWAEYCPFGVAPTCLSQRHRLAKRRLTEKCRNPRRGHACRRGQVFLGPSSITWARDCGRSGRRAPVAQPASGTVREFDRFANERMPEFGVMTAYRTFVRMYTFFFGHPCLWQMVTRS